MQGSSTDPLGALVPVITEIVDAEIAGNRLAPRQKADRTWVTAVDLAIEQHLRRELTARFPTLVPVGEEDPTTHREVYDFTADHLLIDPIDGTENFIAQNGLFGTLLSLRVGADELHLIYLPERGVLITNLDPDPADALRSEIVVMSTKCCRQTFAHVDSLRVFGSSAVMFAMLLQGQAARFLYCEGAKIWDCYTGLCLARQRGLEVHLDGHDFAQWRQRPTHRTAFDVRWPGYRDPAPPHTKPA